MNLCCEVLGWDSLNIETLEDIMKEYKLNINELIDDIQNALGKYSYNINDYLYSALYLGSEKIKKVLIAKYPEYEETINDFEPNISAEYSNNGFASCFGNYYYGDLIGDEKDEYLFNLMNEVLEESGKNKMEKGE